MQDVVLLVDSIFVHLQVAAFNQEFVDSPEGLIITTELIIGSDMLHPIKELVNKVRIALHGGVHMGFL